MKWFKHKIGSTSDRDLMTAISRFGPAGYYVFFETLEVLGRENAIDAPLVVDWAVFRDWFPGVTGPKLRRILEYFAGCRRFSVAISAETLTISCSKFSEISSDYAKKIRTRSEKYPSQTKNEKEKEKKNETDGNIIRRPGIRFTIRGQEITVTDWRTIVSGAGGDERLAARFLFRARKARKIAAYAIQGLKDGYIRVGTKEEDEADQTVVRWIGELLGDPDDTWREGVTAQIGDKP